MLAQNQALNDLKAGQQLLNSLLANAKVELGEELKKQVRGQLKSIGSQLQDGANQIQQHAIGAKKQAVEALEKEAKLINDRLLKEKEGM